MIPAPVRGMARCSRARHASANPANVKAQIGIRMAPRKPRMSFFLFHRKDPKALPQYAEFEASNWTRNDIGVMFWTVAGDILRNAIASEGWGWEPDAWTR